MDKIELIKKAIADADEMKSPSGESTYGVPALTSLKIRHLLNNLGALGTKYLEAGIHKGGTHTATIAGNGNLKEIVAIDNFASDEFNVDDKAQPQFEENTEKFLHPNSKHKLIVSDTFQVKLKDLPKGIDLYLYDGSHDKESQKKALTYFKPVLANEFIFMVDDTDWPEVYFGTMEGIKEAKYEILFQHRLISDIKPEDGGHDNNSYWNGFMVFLLKKLK